MQPQTLPWCDPVLLANSLPDTEMVLLHSSAQASYSGRFSLLACNMVEQVCFDDFLEFEKKLAPSPAPFANRWFGYLGYELKNSLETYTPLTPNWHGLAHGCMMRFASIFQFDHERKTLTAYSNTPVKLPNILPLATLGEQGISGLASNMSKQEYLQKAARIIEATHAGELYQANLTRKFSGHWQKAPPMLALFARLCEQSPAPYSAYIRSQGAHILSSSPELFLRIDANGRMETRPIKGTAPRKADATQDLAVKNTLANDPKNRAENLMIVDLMRNDLSKVAAGKVEVEQLFDVTTHATIHHMASHIRAQKAPQFSALDAVKACFPAGSMTGAPKIRAVALCSELEGVERGVYSGTLGWLDGDGSAELSVIIRTLVAKGNRFEFQVGGGIVADSTPAEEWQETIDKSTGLLKTLMLDRSLLEAL